jgi:hypothetical protein
VPEHTRVQSAPARQHPAHLIVAVQEQGIDRMGGERALEHRIREAVDQGPAAPQLRIAPGRVREAEPIDRPAEPHETARHGDRRAVVGIPHQDGTGLTCGGEGARLLRDFLSRLDERHRAVSSRRGAEAAGLY